MNKLVICSKHKNCKSNNWCRHAVPHSDHEKIQSIHSCVNCNETFYVKYIRKIKLEKIDGSNL